MQSPGKPIAVFQHEKHEGPGKVGRFLEEAGYEWKAIFWPDQPAPPAADEIAGCVIMGGGMNIYQHRDHPWLVPEKEILARYFEAGLPLFGICLGGQFLADMLGTRVVQNPKQEIGWWPIRFEPTAIAECPGLPNDATVLHWHGDTFQLPSGAIPLASSAACQCQGFFFGETVVATQFHPEVDEILAQQFCCGGENPSPWPSGPWVQSREKIVAKATSHQKETDRVLRALLARLFPSPLRSGEGV